MAYYGGGYGSYTGLPGSVVGGLPAGAAVGGGYGGYGGPVRTSAVKPVGYGGAGLGGPGSYQTTTPVYENGAVVGFLTNTYEQPVAILENVQTPPVTVNLPVACYKSPKCYFTRPSCKWYWFIDSLLSNLSQILSSISTYLILLQRWLNLNRQLLLPCKLMPDGSWLNGGYL